MPTHPGSIAKSYCRYRNSQVHCSQILDLHLVGIRIQNPPMESINTKKNQNVLSEIVKFDVYKHQTRQKIYLMQKELSEVNHLQNRPFWSARLRHSEAIIEGITAKRIGPQGTRTDVFVMGNILQQDSLFPLSWRMKIIKKDIWTIHFGIILESIAVGLGFHSSLPKDRYGQYFVTSSLNLSQKGKMINSSRGMSDSDTVFLKYDPTTHLFTVKFDKKTVWQIEVEPPLTGDHYRPCVSLWRDCMISGGWDLNNHERHFLSLIKTEQKQQT